MMFYIFFYKRYFVDILKHQDPGPMFVTDETNI